MADNNIPIVDFGAPEKEHSIIKVIGVGGGGGNAVNHMYREGIHDVNFVVCNTDSKALADSPVPVRLQLGKEGLGAGNRPGRAREAAEESLDSIHRGGRSGEDVWDLPISQDVARQDNVMEDVLVNP